jgi:hypothetical protein
VLSDDRAGLPNNGPHCCKRGHRRRPASAMIEAPPRVYVPAGKRPLRRYASRQSYGQTQCANAWLAEAAITRASNSHASRLSTSVFQNQGGPRLLMTLSRQVHAYCMVSGV